MSNSNTLVTQNSKLPELAKKRYVEFIQLPIQ